MDGRPTLQPPARCPDRDALLAFTAGRMSEPEMELLADHFGTCARCEQTLQELIDSPADSFEAGLLRVCAVLSANPPDPHFASTDTAGDPGAVTFSVGALEPAEEEFAPFGRIGPYALVEVLGRGGMGVVYHAVHRVLKRPVALKTMHPGVEYRADLLRRFRTEGEIIARLQHPNVVRILDFNEADGVPYLSMELIEGETLAQKLTRGPVPIRQAVELVRLIAGAVEYAHSRDVIHRDLKPSNVLIDRSGVAKVSDFGLAKVVEEGRGRHTEPDAVLGTPAYMSPEQAAGRSAEVGRCSDVYALGAILYELLSGVPPFVAPTKLEILALVQAGNPMPPSQLRAEVPADLEAVCLKCMALSPAERFGSAAELAEELDRWLEGTRPRTRRPGWLRRTVRRVGKRRFAGMLGVGALAGLLTAYPPSWAPVPVHENGGNPDAPARVGTDPDEIRRPDGKLLPLRFISGQETAKWSVAADGTLTIESGDTCMLECTSALFWAKGSMKGGYRLRAKVSHEAGGEGTTRVGLYGAYRDAPVAMGEFRWCILMTYDDMLSPADRFAKAPNRDQVQAKTQKRPSPYNYVRLEAWAEMVAGRKKIWGNTRGDYQAQLKIPFTPSRSQAPVVNYWRDCELVLMPETVTANWDRQTTGPVRADYFAKAYADQATSAAGTYPNDGALARIPEVSPFSSTEARAGLYLENCKVSFKDVELIAIDLDQ